METTSANVVLSAKDLRLGNLINIESLSSGFITAKVIALEKNRIIVDRGGIVLSKSPIPVTEAICNQIDGMSLVSLDLCYQSQTNTIEVWCGEYNIFTISFVHQLQNFIYLFAGKDIELQLQTT